jgi:hypothetical protein
MTKEIKRKWRVYDTLKSNDFLGDLEDSVEIVDLTEFNLRKKSNIYKDVTKFNQRTKILDTAVIKISTGLENRPIGLLVTAKKENNKLNCDEIKVTFKPVYNEMNQQVHLVFEEKYQSLDTQAIISLENWGEDGYEIKNPYTDAYMVSVFLHNQSFDVEDDYVYNRTIPVDSAVYGIFESYEHCTEGVLDKYSFKFNNLKEFDGTEKPIEILNEEEIIGKIVSKIYVTDFDTNVKGWLVCTTELEYNEVEDKVTAIFRPIKDINNRKIVIPDSGDNFNDLLFKYKAERDENGKLLFRGLFSCLDEFVKLSEYGE